MEKIDRIEIKIGKDILGNDCITLMQNNGEFYDDGIDIRMEDVDRIIETLQRLKK